MRTKVLIVDRVYNRSKADFDKASDIEFVPVVKDEAVIAEEIKKQVISAIVLATDKYLDELYETLPEGSLIARYGVGHDSIDKAKATAKGQFVTITPGVLDNSVAEHAVFLMGALARQIAVKDAEVRNGNWSKSTGFELNGKTLLVLGCGAIGRRVAQIASFGFGMKVIGYDIVKLDAAEMKQEFGFDDIVESLDCALAQADIVSIHLPAIAATTDYIDIAFLAKMKSGSLIVNTSRGSVLDENSLYNAIDSGIISGAALDVFKNEPYEPQDSAKDLRTLNNVIFTPHLGSSTEEASKRMAESVIANVRAWIKKDYISMDIVNKDVLTQRV